MSRNQFFGPLVILLLLSFGLLAACSRDDAGSGEESAEPNTEASAPDRSAALLPHQQMARDFLKELIEIDTTDSTGDTTVAAQAMADRLLAAGSPQVDGLDRQSCVNGAEEQRHESQLLALCRLQDGVRIGDRVGRRGAPGDRRDEDILAIADETSGHFDHFICRVDDNRRGRGDDEIARMLQGKLVENGVAENAVEVIPVEIEAVAHALDIAREGDLIVIFGDDITRCWKQVINLDIEAADADQAGESKTAQSFVEEDPGAFSLEPGEELIRDERGVRIARHEESD